MLLECTVDTWTDTATEITLRGRWHHAESPGTGETSLLLSASGNLIGVVLDAANGARFIAMRGRHEDVATQVPHAVRFKALGSELQVVIPRTGIGASLRQDSR